MSSTKRLTGMKLKLVLLSFFAVLVANTVMIVFSTNTLKNCQNTLTLDGLAMLAESVRAGYDNIGGEYFLDAEGSFWKGEVNLSERIDLIDNYVKESGADVTVCYGKTRVLTSMTNLSTNQRMIGTDVSDDVWAAVAKGDRYDVEESFVNERSYIACYLPLKNAEGDVIGVVVAGKPRAEMEAYVRRVSGYISGIGVSLLIIFGISGIFVATRIALDLAKAKEALLRLAEGNLDTNISETILKRSDEIGDIGRATMDLIGRLRDIVEKLQASSDDLYETGSSLDAMASSTNTATAEISHAVNDISAGAASQAEGIESASEQIASIGELIGEIVNHVSNLTRISDDMDKVGEASTHTMLNLSESNDRTSAAITQIGEQIRLTDESIKKISSATDLITSIAAQTNLLSLNASIESARAGEAGKGFAVVAAEIQKLSVQSNDAAVEIQQVISAMLSESAETLKEMHSVETLMQEQQEKLDETRNRFDEVSNGIRISRDGTGQIRTSADSCSRAKTAIVEVITDLAAISQENAASTEETSASMQELNSTINQLASEAGKLKDISKALSDYMQFFKL